MFIFSVYMLLYNPKHFEVRGSDLLCKELSLLKPSTKIMWQSLTLKVEKSAFCRSVIEARVKDKLADEGPIWEDVSTVQPNQLGDATGICAGFPCQASSLSFPAVMILVVLFAGCEWGRPSNIHERRANITGQALVPALWWKKIYGSSFEAWTHLEFGVSVNIS